MHVTSSKVDGKIVGHVDSRPTGPNEADQPKHLSEGGRHNQRPSHGKSTSQMPLSYSHRHGSK